MTITYRDAGVDIDAGAAFVDAIAPLCETTRRPEVLGGIGGFAGLCTLPARYKNPVLVSGTDGVGTKLLTAIATDRHTTIGVDLVAMAANDVAVTGAEPLLFLDYLAVGSLDPAAARDIVAGIADGCRQAGCALVGGETAELPGLYRAGDYDLAGFCVGVVERDDIRDGADIAPGDAVIGLPSAGLHANGHALARKALLEALGLSLDDRPARLGGASVADALLVPTIIYVRALRALDEAGARYKAAAHITGGGLIDNPPRMLRDPALAIALDPATWDEPAVFGLIRDAGVSEAEMRRTFNLGVGMAVVVAPGTVGAALAALARDPAGAGARVIGEVIRDPVGQTDPGAPLGAAGAAGTEAGASPGAAAGRPPRVRFA